MIISQITFSYEPDQGLATRAKLGVIVLKTDETLEPEFRTLLSNDGVVVHHSRIESDDEVTEETLAEMADQMVVAASLLPASVGIEVIAYACTSGSTIIGEERVGELIRQAHPDVAVTNPLTAVKANLKALDARRIAVLTPYVPEVTKALTVELSAAGFEVVQTGSFNEVREDAVTRIPPQTTLKAIVQLADACECDAIFASCTNLRTASILEEAARVTGKPVISSNSALAWHMMELAGSD